MNANLIMTVLTIEGGDRTMFDQKSIKGTKLHIIQNTMYNEIACEGIDFPYIYLACRYLY